MINRNKLNLRKNNDEENCFKQEVRVRMVQMKYSECMKQKKRKQKNNERIKIINRKKYIHVVICIKICINHNQQYIWQQSTTKKCHFVNNFINDLQVPIQTENHIIKKQKR